MFLSRVFADRSDFVTGQQTADAMAQLMRVLCRVGASGDGNFVVCDAFACVGGNALAFSRNNFAVVAMEVPHRQTSSNKPNTISQALLAPPPLPLNVPPAR
jgi:hypothetical protein